MKKVNIEELDVVVDNIEDVEIIDTGKNALVSKAKLQTKTEYYSVDLISPKKVILLLTIITGVLFIAYTFFRKKENN